MYKYVAVDMYAIVLVLVGRNIINSSMRRGINDHALLSQSGKILLVIERKI